jgi:glutamate racemase
VVIGTDATIGSHAYRRALEARRVAVREKACPLFVPLVEEGWVEHPVTEQVARIYLSEAFSEVSSRGLPKVLSEVLPNDSGDFSADVLVLGCTHYPLIKPLLRRVAPEHVAIVDSAESTAVEVARQLGRELKIERIAASAGSEAIAVLSPSLRFFATDSAEKFRKMGTRFLGLPVEDVVHVDLKE